MDNKLSKIEILVTAFIFLLACVGITLTVINRVDKGRGQLTKENYFKYMSVKCSVGAGTYSSDGFEFSSYVIEVSAKPNYALQNAKVSYSIKCGDTGIASGTIIAHLKAGDSYSEERQGKFTAPAQDSSPMSKPEITVIINSVSGTYQYIAKEQS